MVVLEIATVVVRACCRRVTRFRAGKVVMADGTVVARTRGYRVTCFGVVTVVVMVEIGIVVHAQGVRVTRVAM